MPEQERGPRWVGAVAGVVAAAVALGVAEFVALIAGPRAGPLVSVGGVVVDHVPAPVKNFATSTFGTHDKTALLIGTTVLLGVFGAVIGVLARRRLWYGFVGIGVFGVVGVTAAVTRAGSGPLDVFPSLIGAGAGIAALARLLATDTRPADTGDPYQRRKFLTESAVLTGGALVVGLIGREFSERRTVTAARAQVTLPTPSAPAPSLPADVNLNVPDLSPFITPNDQFYRIDTALAVPQVAPDSWTLKIHGRVKNPITITYAQLLARPMIERYITLTCVSNEVGGDLIGNARWLGTRVADLLQEAGPMPGADQVVGRAVDGFTVGTPTEVLLDGRDALLAIGMNGVPLPIEHGFPVRMVVPGLYGYVSATKWLAELELTSFADYSAYWIPRGWSAQAPIKTESRIDTPRDGATVRSAQVTVAGVAWAQHRGISKVEVQVDGGGWQEAQLGAVPSVDTWRQWSWSWTTSPGKHTLSVRATDNGGVTQTEELAAPDPNGATGYHTISVSVS